MRFVPAGAVAAAAAAALAAEAASPLAGSRRTSGRRLLQAASTSGDLCPGPLRSMIVGCHPAVLGVAADCHQQVCHQVGLCVLRMVQLSGV